MTYTINDKFFDAKHQTNVALQEAGTTWIEIDGSRCELNFKGNTANIMYKFNFYTHNKYISSTNWDRVFIHVKLQKSNDNFVSNVVDIPGCWHNFSGDTQQSNNFFYKSCSTFFIIEDLDSKYLRLLTRSYSTATETELHRTLYLVGGTQTGYYSPKLIVAEL
jgi:hypothetical protein